MHLDQFVKFCQRRFSSLLTVPVPVVELRQDIGIIVALCIGLHQALEQSLYALRLQRFGFFHAHLLIGTDGTLHQQVEQVVSIILAPLALDNQRHELIRLGLEQEGFVL